MRFLLRKTETAFDPPVSFRASDYDSSQFEVVGDRIVFSSTKGNYVRRKVCGPAKDYDPREIRQIYHQLISRAKNSPFTFTLAADCCALLEDSLSHVELSVEDGQLLLRQRNVYTGSIVEVTPKLEGLLSDLALPDAFGPVAVKTSDFTALFSFHDALQFHPAQDILMVTEPSRGEFDAVLGLCQYDEIIRLYKEGSNGRQESEDR